MLSVVLVLGETGRTLFTVIMDGTLLVLKRFKILNWTVNTEFSSLQRIQILVTSHWTIEKGVGSGAS